MEGDQQGPRPISAKRQKILDMAFAQLRKSRAAMDPSLLKRIRRIIAGSPEMMKKLGIDETLSPDENMPLSAKHKEKQFTVQNKTSQFSEKGAEKTVESKKGYEKIDQAKTMEVMAKFMTLNPDGRDKIKSVIDKAGK